jgi:hypothetical protein
LNSSPSMTNNLPLCKSKHFLELTAGEKSRFPYYLLCKHTSTLPALTNSFFPNQVMFWYWRNQGFFALAPSVTAHKALK